VPCSRRVHGCGAEQWIRPALLTAAGRQLAHRITGDLFGPASQPLRQITPDNVGQLALLLGFPDGADACSSRATPIVANGIVYT
jgi:hypothetical protein